MLARRAEAERSVREAQAGEAAQASDELGDKAKSVAQDEETPKEPKERLTTKMVESEPGAPPRTNVERPRPETDRDSFRPPPGLKRDERDKGGTGKDDKKKRGKNG